MRAKRIFRDLKEDPYVVELDTRGNHPWFICNFNAIAYLVVGFSARITKFNIHMPCRGWAWHSKCSPGPSWASYCATGVCQWPACWWFGRLVFKPWVLLNLPVALLFQCNYLSILLPWLIPTVNIFVCYIIADTVNALSNGQLEKLLGKSQSQWWIAGQACAVKNMWVYMGGVFFSV